MSLVGERLCQGRARVLRIRFGAISSGYDLVPRNGGDKV